jgi:hypothetical protein
VYKIKKPKKRGQGPTKGCRAIIIIIIIRASVAVTTLSVPAKEKYENNRIYRCSGGGALLPLFPLSPK